MGPSKSSITRFSWSVHIGTMGVTFNAALVVLGAAMTSE